MSFRAPSHRIVSQLAAAGRTLDVKGGTSTCQGLSSARLGTNFLLAGPRRILSRVLGDSTLACFRRSITSPGLWSTTRLAPTQRQVGSACCCKQRPFILVASVYLCLLDDCLYLSIVVWRFLHSYAANTVADHYMFGPSEIVSSIGAFTVGLLGKDGRHRVCRHGHWCSVSCPIGPVVSERYHSQWRWYRYWRSNDIGHDWGHGRAFHELALVYTLGSRKSAAVFSF
ncbi:hypothetical protein BKA70DRAFT_574101 [Coprinopsis sp. MPI-PUGE-AT-0042]|nr:hypothetical protein BKA70DRAFT_574101 [Coprinopsis sp. MPI-PUGE-AT-0042]